MCPERLDPVRFYNDTEIYQRLRFMKDDFLYICDLLRPDLQRMTQRNYTLTPEQQLTVALRFYATVLHNLVQKNVVRIEKRLVFISQ